MAQTTAATAASPSAAPPPRSVSIGAGASVRGSFTDGILGTGTAIGATTLDAFSHDDGQLLALTTTTATLIDSRGATLGTSTGSVTTAVTASCSCAGLRLELGHRDVYLLGRVVHLDEAVIDITPRSGPDALMHDLLCAAGYLIEYGAVATLAALLNRLLRLLNPPTQAVSPST
jgi:hypothetical protein